VRGLGAFVVSPSGMEKTNRWGILSPPENFLGFNSEIKHNDGLLANSIAKGEKCSYKEANELIDQYVAYVLQSLDEGKRVHIPWVGSLYSKDNKWLFQPERTLGCNAFSYGLTSFSLPYIKEIQSQETTGFPEKKNKNSEIVWIPVNRRIITYTGSIAAALIAMCIIPTPLNNEYVKPVNMEYTSLISLPSQDSMVKEEVIKVPAAEVQTPVVEKPEAIVSPAEIVNSVKTGTIHYYLVIASFPSQTVTKRILNEFHSKGFEDAAILPSDGRYRIYTKRFDDKTEAEKFLVQFRKDHPAQADAWLLKQKD
jgi:hypothetical protein